MSGKLIYLTRYTNLATLFGCNGWVYSQGRSSFPEPASTNVGLPEISKMKYRNQIPEPGTTISGFADSKKKKKLMPSRTSGS